LSVLIGASERAGDSGTLRLVATGSTVLRPMELTGIAEKFSIYATRDEALAGG
jgi:anti-anti-sigma regulatory factor